MRQNKLINIDDLKKKKFPSFDSFIIEKMMGEPIQQEEIPIDVRTEACHRLSKKLGKKYSEIAAFQTIQKWFGIHGYAMPGREVIFKLCFALGLSEKEVSDYLMRGICEPDFRMNDYIEVIFLYCFHHGMDYSAALDMVEEFERETPVETVLHHCNNTIALGDEFYANCDMNYETFLSWMMKNADEFKGYSMTSLEYFKELKSEILHEIREDAVCTLEDVLKETDFFTWEKKRKLRPKDRKKNIYRYIRTAVKRNKNCLSDVQAEHISELVKIAYMDVDSNAKLLVQLYDVILQRTEDQDYVKKRKSGKSGTVLDINFMNDKHLSDLLNVMIHKDREIHLKILSRHLQEFGMEERCPEELRGYLQMYGCPEEESVTVKSALVWLDNMWKKQGRRCIYIQRNDLLPLIQIVSLKRYIKKIGSFGDYVAVEALNEFIYQANSILAACCMEPLNPDQYKMDAILCCCYQEEEYYFFSEILEILMGE